MKEQPAKQNKSNFVLHPITDHWGFIPIKYSRTSPRSRRMQKNNLHEKIKDYHVGFCGHNQRIIVRVFMVLTSLRKSKLLLNFFPDFDCLEMLTDSGKKKKKRVIK